MMKKIIITIDGWSSCGKSTLAKQLAEKLNYVYIDSGAMYRAITLYFLSNHVDWTKSRAVEQALKKSFLISGITQSVIQPKSFSMMRM